MQHLYTLVRQDEKPAPDGPKQPAPNPLMSMAPFIFIFIIFWFILIRPSMRQKKEREAMLQGVKKNDHIMTSGGIFGVVEKVRERDLILKIDDDVRIRVARSAVAGIEKTSASAEESPSEKEEKVAK